MDSLIIKRVIDEYDYLMKTNETLRKIAYHFNVSKSTVHIDFHDRLYLIDEDKYNIVRDIMNEHIKNRNKKNR